MKRIFSFLLTLAMVLTLLPAMPFTAFAAASGSWKDNAATSYTGTGNGYETTPYLISSGAQLAYLAAQVNSGVATANKYYRLTGNIDLSAHFWVPIGNGTYPFKGNFDGAGFTISGLAYDGDDDYVGLFGHIENASVKNVKLTGVDIKPTYSGDKGYLCVGGVAGYMYNSALERCSVAGVISLADAGGLTGTSGSWHFGGVAGRAYGSVTVSDCFFSGTLDCSGTLSGTLRNVRACTGGIVGWTNFNIPSDIITVKNCAVFGDITGFTQARYCFLGGIAGEFNGNYNAAGTFMKNCYNNNAVITHGGGNIDNLFCGGIAGYATVPVYNCVNKGAVNAAAGSVLNPSTGGIVGLANEFASIVGCLTAR